MHEYLRRKYGPQGPPFPGTVAEADPLAEPPGLGGRRGDAERLAERHPRKLDMMEKMFGLPAPQWLNRDDNKHPDGRCVMFSGAARCGREATHLVWIGCTVGEHLDKSSMCEEHAGRMDASVVLHCQRCWEALAIVSDARIIKVEILGS
jgi:hypothetical protein